MNTIVEGRGLTKRYRDVTAVDSATFAIQRDSITGLLGRNGAGKSTLMRLITGQEFATSGTVSIAGESPVENAGVLQHTCFIKENQRYPEDFKAKHVLASAQGFFPNWDVDFALELADEFRVPLNRRVKKLSRGQLSSLGNIVGLASRAPITIYDEPYLGLDAVARHAFYDRVLADYSQHPRTVIMSTHLIDEVSALLEHVLVIDNGRILFDSPVDALRAQAVTIVGPGEAVERVVNGLDVIHRERLGSTLSATVTGLSDRIVGDARAAGLAVEPVSLQQLIIHRTGGTRIDNEEVSR